MDEEKKLPDGWGIRENDLVGYDVLNEKGDIVLQHPTKSDSLYILAWAKWRILKQGLNA